jgi:hypothetical protein
MILMIINDWKFDQHVLIEHLDLQTSYKQVSSDDGVFSRPLARLEGQP